MFKKIVDFYNTRKASERILMMCTIYMCILVCFFSLRNSGKELDKAMEVQQAKIVDLESMLSLEDRILANLAEVKRNLNESKMIDAQKLQLCIEQCALLAGIDYEISSISESKRDSFHLFTMNLNAKKAQLSNLIDFETMLMNYSPYIRVNSATISASKQSLGASYKVSSFVVN